MVRRRGPRRTLAEKTELWRRWRRGESLNAIGRALGRIAKGVQAFISSLTVRACRSSERESGPRRNMEGAVGVVPPA